MTVTIGALSCNQPFAAERRELCREMWVPVVKSYGYDVVFLIGGHDNLERCGDELCLPVRDDYKSLPQKTKAFCQWAQETDAERLFKCDDDTFIQFFSNNFHRWFPR